MVDTKKTIETTHIKLEFNETTGEWKTDDTPIDVVRRGEFKARSPHITRATLGFCIYCQNEPTGKEHVIPYALAGYYVIRGASCEACKLEIEKFEHPILKKMLDKFTSSIDAPTRKGHPEKLTLEFNDNNGPTEIQVIREQYPMILMLPALSLPTALTHDEVPSEPQQQVKVILSGSDLLAAQKYIEGRNLLLGFTDREFFYRFLAKIAHGLAAGELQQKFWHRYEPLLSDIILKGSPAPWHFVGGTQHDTPPHPNLFHDWGLEEIHAGGATYLMANVRLFACFGGPEYHVLVGRRRSN